VPGVSRYVINLALDLTGRGRELSYDGFAEVWFESEEAMRLSGPGSHLRRRAVRDVVARIRSAIRQARR